jgi:hypothetical protein
VKTVFPRRSAAVELRCEVSVSRRPTPEGESEFAVMERERPAAFGTTLDQPFNAGHSLRLLGSAELTEDYAFILVSLDDNNPFVRKLSSSRVVVPNFGTTLDQPFNAGHSLRLLVYPCTSSQIP